MKKRSRKKNKRKTEFRTYRSGDIEDFIAKGGDIEGKRIKHSQYRHLFKKYEAEKKGSTPFPQYIKPGDITKLVDYAINQYSAYNKGKPNKIKNISERFDDKGHKNIIVDIKLKKYGIPEISASFKDGIFQGIFLKEKIAKKIKPLKYRKEIKGIKLKDGSTYYTKYLSGLILFLTGLFLIKFKTNLTGAVIGNYISSEPISFIGMICILSGLFLFTYNKFKANK